MGERVSEVDVQRARLVVKLNPSLHRPTPPSIVRLAAAAPGSGGSGPRG